MLEVTVKTWQDFRDTLLRFAQLDRDRRNQWWFRGQGQFRHDLVPTIDRNQRFANDRERDAFISVLLSEYRREVTRLGVGQPLPTGDAFELLARHHGLPGPLLDWTRSPYVAAFFAFIDGNPSADGSVAIFALDRARVDPNALDPDIPQVEFVDEPELVQFNQRALQQRGVFLRRSQARRRLEDVLGGALTKFRLPAEEKPAALADLDQMMVNATTLFYDLESAARTVLWRCSN